MENDVVAGSCSQSKTDNTYNLLKISHILKELYYLKQSI